MAKQPKLLALLRRVRLSRTYDVILVRSRHGHSLSAMTDGFRTLAVDPVGFPIVLSFRFVRCFFKLRNDPSRVTRYLCALASSSGASVIIAMDAVRELTDVAQHLPNVAVFSIMHGFYNDQQGLNLREQWTDARESSAILYALGPYDARHYRRWGNIHTSIKVVGSVNNCRYVTSGSRPLDRKFDLCIVQGALNPQADDYFSRIRLANWTAITELVRELESRTGLQLLVALSTSSKQKEIEEWFSDRLPRATFSRATEDPFSTYRAIDSSQVSVGELSTSLIEGLARRNRCITMNFSELRLLSLPGPSLVTLQSPTYEDFEARYWQLRNMGDEEFWESVKDGVSDIIKSDNQHLSISTIRDDLAAACQRNGSRE